MISSRQSHIHIDRFDSTQLPLIWVGILELRTNTNLVEPDLSERLVSSISLRVVVPAVGVQADTELEGPSIGDSGSQVVVLGDLLPIVPHLVEAGRVAAPARLDDDLMPHSGCHGLEAPEIGGLLVLRGAHVPVLDARADLVALDEDHGGGHRVLAAVQVREVGDELGQVVRLRVELPVLLQPEREAVEPRVALLVRVVVEHLRVEAPAPVRVPSLRHLEGRCALVRDVRDVLDGALVLRVDLVPAALLAGVGEGLGGQGSGGCCKQQAR